MTHHRIEKDAMRVNTDWGDEHEENHSLSNRERFLSRNRHCYDHIIRCTGFAFDNSLFGRLKDKVPLHHGRNGNKFPEISLNFESVRHPNMFFLGANAHSLDYKISSGGFLHGFRYMVRNLFNHLRERYHKTSWPHAKLTLGEDFREKLTYRMDTTSGLYQMFSILCDVAVIQSRDGEGIVEYYYDIVEMNAESFVQQRCSKCEFLTLSFQYAPDFHGDKVWGDRNYHNNDPARAHTSQFIHPVIRYWNPKAQTVYSSSLREGKSVPRPTAEFYMLENLYFDWKSFELHIRPLTLFLDRIRPAPLTKPDSEHDVSWLCRSNTKT